jgi:hypothetical protein
MVAAGSAAAQEGEQPAAPLGTAFTYQGRLNMDSTPANGLYDFEFYLFDALSIGSQVGGPVAFNDLDVQDGYFTVLLDFGANAFDGQARFLEVRVRLGSDTGGFTILAPRQELTAAPNALYARRAPWSGLAGVPAGFADGVDNDTTYSAGTGMTLSGGQFSVNTSVIQARVTGACGAGSSIKEIKADGTVTCESDDDTKYNAGTGLLLNGTTFSADTSVLQQRVSGSCAVGSTIRAIAQNGTVECQADAPLHRAAPPASNQLATLDSAGYVTSSTSITIGVDGLGLISYYDASQAVLKTAHCNDLDCSSATTYTLDSAGHVGENNSITIGADGLGLISYRDSTNWNLKVAHCSNTACSSASIYTLDSAGSVGSYTSITIGVDGLGLISYHDDSNHDLKVAHCEDTACSSATFTTLDSAGNVGYYTSITIGADGRGLISYHDITNNDLKAAHCENTACSSATISTLDSAGDVGSSTSITIGVDGLGLISYHDNGNGDLKAAHCDDLTCTSAALYTLNSSGDVGEFTSITIGADGLGLISYYDATNGNFKVAHCSDLACSENTFRTLASTDDVGWYTSITIGTDGLALIAYQDGSNADLKVCHCRNALCVGYFRRR